MPKRENEADDHLKLELFLTKSFLQFQRHGHPYGPYMKNHVSRIMEQNYNFQKLQIDHSNSSCPCCGLLHKNTMYFKIVKRSTLRNIIKKKLSGWKSVNNTLLNSDKKSKFVLFKCHFCEKLVSIEMKFIATDISKDDSIKKSMDCKVEKTSIIITNPPPLANRKISDKIVEVHKNVGHAPPSHSKKMNIKKSNGLSAFLSTLDTNF